MSEGVSELPVSVSVYRPIIAVPYGMVRRAE